MAPDTPASTTYVLTLRTIDFWTSAKLSVLLLTLLVGTISVSVIFFR
jgi:hypothetical protein